MPNNDKNVLNNDHFHKSNWEPYPVTFLFAYWGSILKTLVSDPNMEEGGFGMSFYTVISQII